MIELEFKINKEQLRKSLLKGIEKSNKFGIQCCGFLMPVKFMIDGIDFFYDKERKHKKDEWYDMPLIDFATSFLGEVETLPKKKKNKFIFTHEGYRDILLGMLPSNKAKIINTGSKKKFIVDYGELLKAFKKFEKDVKEFLNKYVPQLHEHPYWGPWVKGQAKWDNEKGLVPIKKKSNKKNPL